VIWSDGTHGSPEVPVAAGPGADSGEVGDVSVELAPITGDDINDVARFLHTHLNSAVPAEAWATALRVPWEVEAPNHGFALRDGGKVVGAYLAFYSNQLVNGQLEPFCNLGAWCVLEDYRFHGLRLKTTMLGQRGYHFTDFSPSGTVIPLNHKLGFTDLDTATALRPNHPWPVRPRRVTLSEDPAVLAATRRGDPQRHHHDHRDTAAAHHQLIQDGPDHCYVVFRKDTRKGLRVFASLLHVSNPEVFHRRVRDVGHHLLVHHGALATLVELRLVGGAPSGSRPLARPRPRMFRSPTLHADDVSYLYSELTCLPW
jgi:hypothetical protein